MKLSFSTKGWHDCRWEQFCDMAQELGFQGIELHNIRSPLFTDRNAPFHRYKAPATVRDMYERKLRIPCIDTLCNLAEAAAR